MHAHHADCRGFGSVAKGGGGECTPTTRIDVGLVHSRERGRRNSCLPSKVMAHSRMISALSATLLALTLVACGSSEPGIAQTAATPAMPGSTVTSASDPSSSAATTSVDPAAEPYVAGLTKGFLSEKSIGLTQPEAECVARGYLDVLGVETFEDADPDDQDEMLKALNKATEDDNPGLVEVFVNCDVVIKAAASTVLGETTGDLSEAQEQELIECVAGKLDEVTATRVLRGQLGGSKGQSSNDDSYFAGITLTKMGTECGFKMVVYP